MTPHIAFMRLSSAWLCECGLIGNNPITCACGNSCGLLNLAAVLNRTPAQPRPALDPSARNAQHTHPQPVTGSTPMDDKPLVRAFGWLLISIFFAAFALIL